MPIIVKLIFALLTVAFGVFAFWQPEPVAKGSGFKLESVAGRAELRIAFGGFFMGLGLAAIWLGRESDVAYQMLGMAYLITFITRLLALAVDGTDGVVRREYLIYGAFELISGVVLFLPKS